MRAADGLEEILFIAKVDSTTTKIQTGTKQGNNLYKNLTNDCNFS